MANKFINHIIDLLNLKENRLSIIKNTDRFFYRKDVLEELDELKFRIVFGSALELRIDFELNYKRNLDHNFLYLIDNREDLLEDMRSEGCYYDFQLISYFPEYSPDTIQNYSLYELYLLYFNKPTRTLSESQTAAYLRRCVTIENSDKDFISQRLLSDLKSITSLTDIIWENVILPVSKVMLSAIKAELWEDIKPEIENLNERFQQYLLDNFKSHIIPSSFAKRPRIVSNVLPYLNLNFKTKDKIALIVIDGMSYWQYLMLSSHFGDEVESSNEVIYSWIPSITQLSRQAIFRGLIPQSSYKQDPTNEANLWYTFWRQKGLLDAQIRYDYNSLQDKNLNNILRLALVDISLDEKMHASSDYNDLYDLTQNWIENTGILPAIHRLLSEDFEIFLTTDHGNIKAKSLTNIGSKEKLGTNKSGSRSLRHLEYSDNWLKEQFLANHSDWLQFLGQDKNTIYIKNDLAFSNDDSLVTHGGSHFLEVLIPFTRLKKVNK